ncbi:MAG: hypothetical protein ACR2MP_14960 [Streptosporangiaceae bacterium]
MPLLVLLFPGGRRLPRLWRWGTVACLAANLAFLTVLTVNAGRALASGHHPQVDRLGQLTIFDHTWAYGGAPVSAAMFAVLIGFGAASVTHQVRSWRHASGERRQQLKWLMSGATVCLGCAIAAAQLGGSTRGTWHAVGDLLLVGVATLPLSVGLGILKYRLYDIDRIISRTLAYAIITGLQVGVYAGLVLLATQVLGFASTWAVAASTLAAAALFTPVRRRVQRAVDRRFNRARYAADAAVAAFAAGLSGAVALDEVRADLVGSVIAALEPAHVSVWLESGPRVTP